MKTALFSLAFVAWICLSFVNPTKPSKTTGNFNTFDTAMIVHLYHGGGMYYGSLNIYIKYDSCIRVDMDHGKELITKFAMSDEYRSEVLTILNKTNAKNIREDNKDGIAYDKATSEICITEKINSKFCFSSGASSEIAERSKADFYELWKWIEEFSVRKK